jgi:hypothetical protein
MSYISLPVPEEHLPAVYDLLASLTRGEPRPTGGQISFTPDDGDDMLARLVHAVADETRTVLAALARTPDTWLTFAQLGEAAHLKNAGGAMMSLSHHCDRLNMPWPIEKRRVKSKYVYLMTADTSARIQRIMEGA